MSPDLRDWVPEGHLVHFIMDAVRLLDVCQARGNERGTGSPQYPPTLMLGLLIYSCATDTFRSRQIERANNENVAVRLLCADRHPDHDSICTFRRTNGARPQSRFEQVLAMAAQMRVLKLGKVTLAIDGTKILANASKHSVVSHGHATEQIQRLEKQVSELLAKAEAADSAPLEDGLTLPDEIARRQDSREQLRAANEVIRARAKERYERELAEFQAKEQERAEQTGKKPQKRAPKPYQERPRAKDQFNFTDPESRIMNTPDGFEQSYNAQAAVEIDSRLREGGTLADAPNGKEKMKHRLGSRAGRELCAQRKQTIEPIFGIIKATLGFRRLSLSGLKKVRTEWTLVTLAYNLKRLFRMGAALSEA